MPFSKGPPRRGPAHSCRGLWDMSDISACPILAQGFPVPVLRITGADSSGDNSTDSGTQRLGQVPILNKVLAAASGGPPPCSLWWSCQAK